jgi:DNA helicase MCM8
MCVFILYLSANSIEGLKSTKFDTTTETTKSKVDMDFTKNDMEFFEELKSGPNVFKDIVNSLCPSIFGHELVKAGLILGIFGGSKKSNFDGVPVRADPHILVVGDPGLGKSQILRACANISPRGVLVCGNATTNAGLTVTVCKDSDSDFSLEAGALLCAHNGCCCIDEFDKMGNQQQTLLEAMEQQCISIAKGGIVCSIPCRTTVLATANPCGGHYDKSRTVSENLKLSGPLLSRFDLLFILLDKPNEALDLKVSSHIISMHRKKNKQTNDNNSYSNYKASTTLTSNVSMNISKYLPAGSELDDEDYIPLSEKLKLNANEVNGEFSPVPPVLLKKYIMYAKRHCDPVISNEAAQVLRDFYIHLRHKSQRINGFSPITMRQLESLIRLTQARAKCEMRLVCTASDANDVIEIMRTSMFDYYENEVGLLDFSRKQNGSGSTKTASVKSFVAILQQDSVMRNDKKFTFDQIKDLAQVKLIKICNQYYFN